MPSGSFWQIYTVPLMEHWDWSHLLHVFCVKPHLQSFEGFLKQGYPHSSSILLGFFSINHPAIGVPPSVGNFHLYHGETSPQCSREIPPNQGGPDFRLVNHYNSAKYRRMHANQLKKRQIDRQIDRSIDRQIDTQIDRQIYRWEDPN